VSITLEQSESLSVIRLEGCIDISSAAELKEFLLGALTSGKEARVWLDAVTDLDVTAIELLWAAEREARRTGAGFSLTGPMTAGVSAALAGAGLDLFQLVQEASQA
jgi:anti-anti-sigma factor